MYEIAAGLYGIPAPPDQVGMQLIAEMERVKKHFREAGYKRIKLEVKPMDRLIVFLLEDATLLNQPW
ncbi:MAG TPA: hypothetical protein VD996_13640 [Chitinophagaceae bacterium]|nr:hypothetical protein [Chitinophagaceae bacterium]